MMAEIDVHIVGIGNLGKSFLGGFSSISEGPNLYLYESNKDIVDSFSGKQEIKSTLGQLDEGVLLLCIKPNNLNEFIETNKELISPDVLIVTALAGLNITHFENIFKNKILRLMPNLSIKIITVLFLIQKIMKMITLDSLNALMNSEKPLNILKIYLILLPQFTEVDQLGILKCLQKLLMLLKNSEWKKRKPKLLLNN